MSFIFLILTGGAIANSLSPMEESEVNARVHRFYNNPSSPEVMDSYVPKYSINKQRWVHSHADLQGNRSEKDALLQMAGKKASPEFQKHYCESVLKKHFPEVYELSCRGRSRAQAESKDNFQNLTTTWIDSEQLERSLDGIPTEGETSFQLWSDDYWRIRWGLTSFRYGIYAHQQPWHNYTEAVAVYAQPAQWLGSLALPPADLTRLITDWSPSEKYDLTVGDESFALTREQKGEGADLIGPNGDVEDWMGICHGWSAANMKVPAPMKTTTVIGAKGAEIPWYPADTRALASLAWANGTYKNNFVGLKCQLGPNEIVKYPNGRIQNQNCFDSNPATLHLLLGNMIGKQKQSFVMDEQFDYEVWNQAMQSYEFTYFNLLDPNLKSKKWSDVAVDYDTAFKEKDRFQTPLTRGTRSGTTYNDSGIQKVVGVIASLVYLSELLPPEHTPTPQANYYERLTIAYDLELQEIDGKWIPTGGEWHQNAHPDFFWIPQKTSVAQMPSFDQVALAFDGAKVPDALVTQTATRASPYAYPLCRVVKELVKRSAEGDGYPCP